MDGPLDDSPNWNMFIIQYYSRLHDTPAIVDDLELHV